MQHQTVGNLFRRWRLFLQRHVPAEDAFDAAMLRSQQQRAVIIQRFRAPANRPAARPDGHRLAKRGSMFLPLIGHVGEESAADAGVIMIQFAQNGRGKFCSRNYPAGFQSQR